MRALLLALLVTAAVQLLSGCGSTSRPAPVSERGKEARSPAAKLPAAPTAAAAQESDWRPSHYVVRKGDTLFSIALDHGLDYRELAQWNDIANPNVIQVGQRLALSAPEETVTVTPLRSPGEAAGVPPAASPPVARGEVPALKTSPKAARLPYSEQAAAELAAAGRAPAPAPPLAAPPAQSARPAAPPVGSAAAAPMPLPPGADSAEGGALDWAWPARGQLIGSFTESAKGIEIGGQLGQPVLASAPGKVVYSGTGLRGYGKLIIIKHNKDYLSAYAHNHRVLVKEGESVARGQRIAEMGASDSDRVKLHFEIRRLGRPVDPLKYLPSGGAS